MTDPQQPTDADLAHMLDAARGAEAARQRSAQRWLRQQAQEEARLTGVLLSAAEQAATVVVRTTSARSYSGAVTSVGGDFIALHTSTGASVFIKLDAITVVQLERTILSAAAADDRGPGRDVLLQEALVDLAGDRPDVSVYCLGQADAVVGRLIAVGSDVVTLQVDDRRAVAYVALSSVTELSLRASG